MGERRAGDNEGFEFLELLAARPSQQLPIAFPVRCLLFSVQSSLYSHSPSSFFASFLSIQLAASGLNALQLLSLSFTCPSLSFSLHCNPPRPPFTTSRPACPTKYQYRKRVSSQANRSWASTFGGWKQYIPRVRLAVACDWELIWSLLSFLLSFSFNSFNGQDASDEVSGPAETWVVCLFESAAESAATWTGFEVTVVTAGCSFVSVEEDDEDIEDEERGCDPVSS